MKARLEYEKWLSYTKHSDEIIRDLRLIENDEEEIEERFGCELQFGTGGLRGIMGAGLNRMNIHTVRRASWALAHDVLLREATQKSGKIVIGYDCRHKSADFAMAAGLVMAAVGVKAYVFPCLCPTPELSFTVRSLMADAGVMITASHNPPQYNGYKVYGSDGGQILPGPADRIQNLMAEGPSLFDIPTIPLDRALENGLFMWVPESIRDEYVDSVLKNIMSPEVSSISRKNLRVVYTPLHGTGSVPIQKALNRAGYEHVFCVAEQMEPDGEFPTVKSPNPEESEALDMGIQLAKRVQADIVLGTDPDADRVGIAVRDARGEYRLLTGNQVGSLLVNFVLADRKKRGILPGNGIVFKTIVTSELGQAVAGSYGVHCEDTLTGFKYIGERITHYEQTGEYEFLFGYEESYGYLLSPIVRDKDAVQTVLAIVEMAAKEQAHQRTLLDSLEQLFAQFGCHKEILLSVSLPGANGMVTMREILAKLRTNPLSVPITTLVGAEDYLTSSRTIYGDNQKTRVEYLTLPTADVLKFFYADGTWVAIRPSGTEPKLKAYVAVKGSNEPECAGKLTVFQNALREVFGDNEEDIV